MVMVSLHYVAEAFFAGVDHFLVDVFADQQRRPMAEARLKTLILEFPLPPDPC
jgi:hypothetical protein